MLYVGTFSATPRPSTDPSPPAAPGAALLRELTRLPASSWPVLARPSALLADSGPILDKLIKAFDLDSNGHVDFQEFCICLSKLCGKFDEQLEFVFGIWDADGSGYMELWELADAMEDAQVERPSPAWGAKRDRPSEQVLACISHH